MDSTRLPMDITDLENWEKLFSFMVRGIEDHLIDDKPDPDYVVSALMSMDRQLSDIIRDLRTWQSGVYEELRRSGTVPDLPEPVQEEQSDPEPLPE